MTFDPTQNLPAQRQEKLTEKQKLFAKEYLVDLNATQAAIRAGYDPEYARVVGPRMIGQPKIQALVAEEMEARAKRTEITADKVLNELARIGFSDIGRFFTVDGSDVRLDFSKVEDGDLRVVSEITQDEYQDGRGDDARTVKRTKIKLHDKLGALDKIAKHLGMFIDRKEITGKNGGPIQVEAVGIAGLLAHAKGLKDVTPKPDEPPLLDAEAVVIDVEEKDDADAADPEGRG